MYLSCTCRALAASAVGAVLIIGMIAYIAYQQFMLNRAILRNEWRIPQEDVQLSKHATFQVREVVPGKLPSSQGYRKPVGSGLCMYLNILG